MYYAILQHDDKGIKYKNIKVRKTSYYIMSKYEYMMLIVYGADFYNHIFK